ncbi:MAG: hypothetical protein HZA65_02450 [Rhodocyclales bacterium]|nr:hypothetical protein [Rhodocyclales bacterium]
MSKGILTANPFVKHLAHALDVCAQARLIDPVEEAEVPLIKNEGFIQSAGDPAERIERLRRRGTISP